MFFMEKITMTDAREQSLAEIFELFTVSQSARGVAEVTLRNYRYHMREHMTTMIAQLDK